MGGLDDVFKKMDKTYGAGLTKKASTLVQMDRIPTGIFPLDLSLGGGFPINKISEIYGPESCLAGDTYIPFEVWNDTETLRVNHKGGSIQRLYERFTGSVLDDTPKQGRHLQREDIRFFVKSVNDEGMVVRNEILNVVSSGIKTCYVVETSKGFTLTSTKEHKYLTPEGYVPLGDLKIGSTIYVHNNTRVKGRKIYQRRPDVMVKYHPHLPPKIITTEGKSYLYYRGQVSRLVYEAYQNNMSYEDYILCLNTSSKDVINSLWHLPKNIHVHHRDENFLNNSIDNLELIDPSEHGRLHSKDRICNLSFITVEDNIIGITPVGITPTYDLVCSYPYNNYIANGIVVHNSGKTNIALKALAMHQKLFPTKRCLFIDAEHSFDKVWAAKLGVDINHLDIYTPPYAEQTADVLEQCLLADDMGLVILDSVAALATTAEIEKSAEGFLMGGPAILMGRLVKKALVSMSRSAGEGRYPTLLCINQVRTKVGQMFGDPETTPGGRALPFYASIRLRTYGKNLMENSVSAAMPTFKETSTVVKKWKVPITSVNSVFKIANIAHKGLNIGDADDWNTLSSYAKNYGLLMKAEKGTGWVLGETQYSTLQAVRDVLYGDVELGNTMRNYIIEMALGDTSLPTESDDGPKGKKSTE